MLNLLAALASGIGLMMLVPILQISGWLDGPMPRSLAFLSGRQWPLPLSLFVFVGLVCVVALIQKWNKIQTNALRLDFLFQLQSRLNRSIANATWSCVQDRKLKDVDHALSMGVEQVTALTIFTLQLLSDVILIVVYVGLSASLSVPLTLLTLVAGTLMLLLGGELAFQHGRDQLLRSRRAHERLAQFLDGIKLAQSYNLGNSYVHHFEELVQSAQMGQREVVRRESTTHFAIQCLSAATFAIFFFVAVRMFHIAPTTLVTMLVLYSRLMPRLTGLQRAYLRILSLVPVFTEVSEMIHDFENHPQTRLSPSPGRLAFHDRIRFEGVSYDFPGKPVLSGIDCEIRCKKTTALVGRSGAGKTTFADLLLGLLSPTHGAIWVDDVPLRPEHFSAWRNCVSYVPQEPYFFHDSIRENLKWVAPGASDSAVWEVLEMAAADGFVRALPQRLDSVVGDKGTRLSGGERQRLALARALLRKPQMLILDEATSALDLPNEELIHQALKRLQGTTTVLIIAHRFTTIQFADEVILLDGGRVAERGTTGTLLEKADSLFSELFPILDGSNESSLTAPAT